MIPDYINTCKSLIKAGANVNAKNNNGTTPLMITNCPEITKLLIEAGADVNAIDKNGYTALMYAAISGNAEKTKLLIEADADVNDVAFDGSTALSLAKAGVKASAVANAEPAGEILKINPRSIHKNSGG